ncbi:MAG: hypothetical protein PHE84_08295 [bacterium]|nr:hypothetical protein [bacterium]
MIKSKATFSILLPAAFFGAFLFTCGGGGGISRTQDTDGDGMPDYWEIQYGLNPSNPNDASLDLDNDGYTNLEEYQGGTDPTVPDPPKELCNGLDDDGNGFIDEIWLEKGKPCGKCGIYQCSLDGLALECQGEGTCAPGENKICGTNGIKTCLATCEWNDCVETPQCPMTGQVRSAACGYCGEGTQRATCLSNGTWGEWGACEDLGCRPGADIICFDGTKGGTKTCGDDCRLGDCAAGCTPGARISEVCGECGGTRARICLTGGVWGPPGDCVCAEQSASIDVPGYGTQTRTCGIETGCNWSSWGYCGGGECSFGDVETETCGCGGHGLTNRTCGDDCAWGEWSACSGDYDEIPPSRPVPGTPRERETVTDFPVPLTWTASSDACGLSENYAYELNVSNDPVFFPSSVTRETNSTSYLLDSVSHGTWYWRVRARDASGNLSDWSPAGRFEYLPEQVFIEDFDGVFPGNSWRVGDLNPAGGDDYWDQSNSRVPEAVFTGGQAGGMTYSAWCAGKGRQGDADCGGGINPKFRNYDNGMEAYLERDLDLLPFTQARLIFRFWQETADAGDCLKVKIFKPGQPESGVPGTWNTLFSSCSDSSGWELKVVDLSEYAGDWTTLQFVFESDGSGHCAEGAYLDNIVVEGW